MRFSVGKRVVLLMFGNGIETAYLRTVEHVDQEAGLVFLDGCDGYYTEHSMYAYYDRNGRGVNSYAPGFTSRIVPLSEV